MVLGKNWHISRFSKSVAKREMSHFGRVLHAFWLKGGADAPPWLRQGGHFEVKEGHPIFTNNMIFLECGVIALFEAFYMLRDHNHVKMKF